MGCTTLDEIYREEISAFLLSALLVDRSNGFQMLENLSHPVGVRGEEQALGITSLPP